MPNRQTRRSKKSEFGSMSIKIEDITYNISLGEFSSLDEFDFYQATSRNGRPGLTLMECFQDKKLAGASFVIAGMVWLHRRKSEPELTYEEVMASLHFEDLMSIKNDDDAETETTDNPES